MEEVSREFATVHGLKRYFTGIPCRRGHLAERFINSGRCIECNIILCSEWSAKNTELKAAADKKYNADNRESIRATKHEYYKKHRETIIARAVKDAFDRPKAAKQRKQDWKTRNPQSVNFDAALRRARKKQAVPNWFSELDEFVWREAAHLSVLRAKLTGMQWDCDHMIPIRGRGACGLHIAANCQVIPGHLNRFKNNKMIFTEPFEWMAHV